MPPVAATAPNEAPPARTHGRLLAPEPILRKRWEAMINGMLKHVLDFCQLAPLGVKATTSIKNYAGDGLVQRPGQVMAKEHDPFESDMAERAKASPNPEHLEAAETDVERAKRVRSYTAAEAYVMEIETAAIVKAAEEMLTFNRALKEAWLFGKLDTLGNTGAEGRTEAEALKVAELLPKVVNGAERVGDAQS